MDDIKPVEKSAPKEKKAKKVTFTIPLGLATKMIIALLAVLLVFGIYKLGDRNGANREKTSKTNGSSFSSASTANRNASRRWSSIGTITDVNDKTIKVKDARGKEQTASFTKDTIVTSSDGKQTDAKALKKDQKVIVTGDKDEKGNNLTVSRIRIQK